MTPQDISLKENNLLIQWQDSEHTIPVPVLRAACRCKDCRLEFLWGNTPEVAADIRITGIEPVGSYGVQLKYSDGHERGIYPWVYLRELSSTRKKLEFAYSDHPLEAVDE